MKVSTNGRATLRSIERWMLQARSFQQRQLAENGKHWHKGFKDLYQEKY